MTRLISVATFLLLIARAPAQTADEKADEFFSGKGPVPTLRIEVDKVNFEMLRKDVRKYVRAIIRNDTVVYRDVGLHLKGAAGSFRNWEDKPALTINSNKFKKGQTFNGLDKFHLNNSVQDGSYFHELISGDLFRAVGVPAPRCAHVMVELNGRKVGLYVLKEGFDETYSWPATSKTTPATSTTAASSATSISHSNWTVVAGNEWADLKALAKACREPEHAKRLVEIGKRVDLDKFYTFWTLEVLTVDWDGYTRNRNNYRIYHDPKSDQFVFFAHGKDQLFQNAGDSLVHGWGGLCARTLYETEEGKKRYHKTLSDIVSKHFDVKVMHARIDALSPRVVEALKAVDPSSAKAFEREVRDVKRRIKERVEWVKAEIVKLN